MRIPVARTWKRTQISCFLYPSSSQLPPHFLLVSISTLFRLQNIRKCFVLFFYFPLFPHTLAILALPFLFWLHVHFQRLFTLGYQSHFPPAHTHSLWIKSQDKFPNYWYKQKKHVTSFSCDFSYCRIYHLSNNLYLPLTYARIFVHVYFMKNCERPITRSWIHEVLLR